MEQDVKNYPTDTTISVPERMQVEEGVKGDSRQIFAIVLIVAGFFYQTGKARELT